MSGFLIIRTMYTHCMWFGKSQGNAKKKTKTSNFFKKTTVCKVLGKCVNTFNHWPPEFHVLIIVGRREIS